MNRGALAARLRERGGERRVDVVELAELCQVYGADPIALLRAAGLCA